MEILFLTDTARFVASMAGEFLLADDHTFVGVDNLNDTYSVRLKECQLAQLEGKPEFIFHRIDITVHEALRELWMIQERESVSFNAVINLMARVSVRQSVESPWVYSDRCI